MRLRVFTIAVAAAAFGVGSDFPYQPRLVLSAPRAPALVGADGAELAPPPPPRAALIPAESALGALRAQVKQKSHPDALRLAFQAYYNYRAAHPREVKPYLYFVDYGLDSRTPRGYVFDMVALRVVEGPFTVAHGRGSDADADGVPTRFSSRNGSAASSLGLYLAEGIYDFKGKTGGRSYRSLGLRLRGVSGHFNNTAKMRGVVVHGAPYVTPDKAGRSEGCPAMEESRAARLIPQLENGGLVYLFSPLDAGWLREEPWAHGTGRRMATAD
jgi:hypothetical protein